MKIRFYSSSAQVPDFFNQQRGTVIALKVHNRTNHRLLTLSSHLKGVIMKKRLCTTLIGLLAMQAAVAVPTIYPTEVSHLSTIINPTNSNLVSDNVDPNTFWVLPPNTGASEVGNLHSLNANIGFCREMGDLQGYSRQTSEKINELVAKEVEQQNVIDSKLDEIARAKINAARFAQENDIEELVKMDERVAEIEDRIVVLSDELQTCTQNCSDLRSQKRILQKEKREELRIRRRFAAQHRYASREYQQRMAVVEAMEDQVKDLRESHSELRARLLSVKSTFISLYSSFAKMEGARASIKFKNDWESNLVALRENNPSYSFQKIPTQNAVITTALNGLEGIPAAGGILSYNMDGQFSEGTLRLPAYPEETTGLVTLSLIGACPMVHPEYFDIDLPNGTQEMSYGLTVSYEYPTAFVVSATAKYNMYKMYQKIAKSKKRGGLFRSKRMTSLKEKTFFRDSFKVEWKEQDPQHSLSAEEKAELEREWRNAIFGRLAAIGLPAAAAAGTLELPAPPASGAVVLGNSLQNNRMCQSNAYCMGAAIGVKVLGAIFGSSTSTNNYTNIQDAELTEEWSRETVIYKPWISTYQ